MSVEKTNPIDHSLLPSHVGIIMDGNGRWAKKKGLSRSEGHKAGAEVFRKISNYGCDLGIRSMTFYAFSTENWKRPEAEVSSIMELFKDYVIEADEKRDGEEARKMAIHFLGDLSAIPEDIAFLARSIEGDLNDESKTIVNLAVNYGGQQEILDAVKKIAKEVEKGKIKPDEITTADIESRLYTAGQPMPDLIIRPSGEYRLSNFLVWQSAYAEFWYSDIMWPDFTTEDFDMALRDYANRNRRFGGV